VAKTGGIAANNNGKLRFI